jgi:catechol 2,3-dioxygenase-like lactoylglutathione lyase family enzyme
MVTFSHPLIFTSSFDEANAFFREVLGLPAIYASTGFSRLGEAGHSITLHAADREGSICIPVFFHEKPETLREELVTRGYSCGECSEVAPGILAFEMDAPFGLRISISNAGYHRS